MNTSNEIPLTDEKSWRKHPQRIEPILHFDKVSGEIITLGIISIFMVVPLIVSFIPMLLSGNASFIGYGLILAWYGVLGFIAYALWRQSVAGIIWGRRFMQSQAQTKARILRRQIIQHSDNYGRTTNFFLLQLEFTPFMPNSIGSIRLVAAISSAHYDSLLNSETVNITYATQDPRVFLIEGE